LALTLVAALATLVVAPSIALATGIYGTGAPIALETGGPNTRSVVVDDFNGDGIPDILASNMSGASLTLFRGLGAGSFAAGSQITSSALYAPGPVGTGVWGTGASAGALVANPPGTNVLVLLPDGSGSLAVTGTVAVGAGPTNIVSDVDFNNDGKSDFAVANQGDGTISVRLGDGHGHFSAPGGGNPAEFSANDATYVTAGDLNVDGNTDLVVANGVSGGVRVFLGNGAGGFTAVTSGPVEVGPTFDRVTAPYAAYVDDVNLDGNPDVLTANGQSPFTVPTQDYAFSVLFGDGTGVLSAPVTYASGIEPYAIAAGDLDGDGFNDYATVDEANVAGKAPVSILFDDLANLGSLSTSATVYGEATAYDLTIGDMNGDGVADVLTSVDLLGSTGHGGVDVLLGDNVPPTTSIIGEPANYATDWIAQDASLTISASDVGLGVDSSYYALDGGTPVGYTSPFHVSTEGTSVVTYWSVDKAGLSDTPQQVTVQIDKTPPEVGISGVPSGWTALNVGFTVDATDTLSGLASRSYQVDSGGWMPYTAPVYLLTDGDHVVDYAAHDAAGNGATQTVHAKIDQSPPVTTSDAAPQYAHSGATIHLSPSDPYSGVASTWYSVDGAGFVSGTTVHETVEGTHTLQFYSTDNLGNSETANEVQFFIQPLPTTTISGLPAGWVNHDVVFTLSATDVGGPGVASTFYALGGGGDTLYSQPVTITAEGVTQIGYHSIDASGNNEPTHTTSAQIDRTLPIVTTAVNPVFNGTAYIPITGADGLSGVAQVRWSLDGGPDSNLPAAVTSVGGPHTLRVVVIDAAGNESLPVTYGFTVLSTATRVGGYDRYAVAVNLAQQRWPGYTGMHHVIVVCGEDRANADPLASAGLAGVWNAPILLTTTGYLFPTTKTALQQMRVASGPLAIHVIGGTASVPNKVLNDIRAANPGGTTERIDGHDRYQLSANIAARMKSEADARGIPIDNVIIFNAENSNAFFDALAASTMSAHSHMPMIAVQAKKVPTSASWVLANTFAGKPRWVANSTAYLPAATYNAVGAAGRMSTTSDNKASAVQINTFGHAKGWIPYTNMGLAARLPDALTGGAFLGLEGGVITYTNTSPLSSATSAFVYGARKNVSHGWVFGSNKSVADSTVTQFNAVLNAP
jgi:hypothetical protein